MAKIGVAVVLLLIVGLVILWGVYLRGNWRRRQFYRFESMPAPTAANFLPAIASLTDSFISQGWAENFWVEGEAIRKARQQAVQGAKHSIQFETYIMTPGQWTDEFAAVLCERARAGVKVQLIGDRYGTKSLPQHYWQGLRAAGVEVRFFRRFRWNHGIANLRRNHRKLLIVDDRLALVGGAGVSDRWNGWDKIGDTAPWRDYEVSFEGPLLPRLLGIFYQHWLDCGGAVELTSFPADVPSKEAAEPVLVTSGEDPSYRDSGTRSLYQSLIQGAVHRIWISSPYFLPDRNTRALLSQAAQRGVEVRIVTMGDRCDKPFVLYAGREFYEELLQAGVEIYEYQPSMLHAKVVLVDSQWVSLGSANFDPRSFFQNDELNVTTSQAMLIEQLEQFLQVSFERSELISKRWLRQRSWRERAIAAGSLLFYWQL